MAETLASLERRMGRVIRTWHPALVRSFGEYSSRMRKPPDRARPRGPRRKRGDPYWLLLPVWLAEQFERKGGTGGDFLRDVLMGQYCAFLAIKIHDDVFDGHAEDRSLIFAADHLVLSTREAFAPHFHGRSGFWPFLDSSFRGTIDSIAGVDQSQLRGWGPAPRAAKLISGGYSVCNLATYAVCLRENRAGLFGGIRRCTDELAYVGQVLDDLEDIEEDLARGRINYAAWSLLRSAQRDHRGIAGRLARGLMRQDLTQKFFDGLRGHLRLAAGFAEAVRVPRLLDHVGKYAKALDATESALHRKLVDLVHEAVMPAYRN